MASSLDEVGDKTHPLLECTSGGRSEIQRVQDCGRQQQCSELVFSQALVLAIDGLKSVRQGKEKVSRALLIEDPPAL